MCIVWFWWTNGCWELHIKWFKVRLGNLLFACIIDYVGWFLAFGGALVGHGLVEIKKVLVFYFNKM
jgi:hypothetical protein